MIYKHLKLLVDGRTRRKSRIQVTTPTDIGGVEHRLWTTLNTYIPPTIAWKHVKGHERAQIRRAGAALDKAKLPYTFYAEYLRVFGRAWCKRNPLLITALKRRKNGNLPLLLEFIDVMTWLLDVYTRNKIIIDIVDSVYDRFPAAYGMGLIKYVYSVDIVTDALNTHTPRWVWSEALTATSLQRFWDALGKAVDERETQAIDLSRGTVSAHLHTLQRERRIRVGIGGGVPNPLLNKYFNKTGKINARGLKLLQDV